jgi:hypothetical protein
MNVSNPFLVRQVILQYATYNVSNHAWSVPINVTSAGMANSFKLNCSGSAPFAELLWSRNATSQSYLQIYNLTNGRLLFNASIVNASSIVSYRSLNQTSIIRLLNGTYLMVVCNLTTGALYEYQIPAPAGYAVREAGIAQNSTSAVYVLYENRTYGDLFMVYDASNPSSWISIYYTNPPVATSIVRYIYGRNLSFLAESTNDTITIYPIGTLPGIVNIPGREPVIFSFTAHVKNITDFGILDVNGTLVVYTLSNYGNTTNNLLNLSLTFEPVTAPPVPVLQIVSANATVIELNWSVRDSSHYDISGYMLYSSMALPGMSGTMEIANSTHSYIIVPDGAGDYTFKLAAFNAFGISAFSNPASIKYYSATFNEKGLPGGTRWSVDAGGGPISGTAVSLATVLPDGAYPFTIPTAGGFTAFPSSGSLNISGTGASQAILFARSSAGVYELTFEETGLPLSTAWSVNLSGLNSSSTSHKLNVYETNGTYAFSVWSAAHYFASPATGYVAVSGKQAYREIAFALSLHDIYFANFTERGLPDRMQWSVTLDGVISSSFNGTVSFSEVNGSYVFRVNSIPGFTVTPSAGSVNVHGKSVAEVVAFTPANFFVRYPYIAPVLVVSFIVIAIAAVYLVVLRKMKKQE